MRTWQTETSPYLSEIEAWREPLAQADGSVSAVGLTLPLPHSPTLEEHLAINLLLLPIGTLRVAHELLEGLQEDWSHGRFVAVA
jgi:hypothetical protein